MSSVPHHISFSSYPEPGSETFYDLPVPLQDVLDNCALFIEEVTASAPGSTVVSRMSCKVELDKYYICEGEIELVQQKSPSEIHWKCRKCGKNSGVISNFKGCRWDLSDVPELHAQQYLYDKYDAVVGNQKVLPDLPFDLTDREDNREFFDWLENLNEEDQQEFARMLAEKFQEHEEQLAAAFDIGLDPDELESLILCDWRSPAGPLVLNDDLSFEEIEHTFYYRNARIFLLYLQDEKEFGLTSTGNLKRKTISRLLDKGRWQEGYVEELNSMNKVINETDAWQLHMINVLLQQAGLVKKRNNKLKPVQKHLHLIEKEHAGTLYRRLFYTYFRVLNISYIIRYQNLPFLQESMAFTLYRLHELADDWSTAEDLFKKALLESVRLDILRSLYSEYQQPESRMKSLVLRPLVFFGLIETRYNTILKASNFQPDRPEQFRKTALFERFIEFRF